MQFIRQSVRRPGNSVRVRIHGLGLHKCLKAQSRRASKLCQDYVQISLEVCLSSCRVYLFRRGGHFYVESRECYVLTASMRTWSTISPTKVHKILRSVSRTPSLISPAYTSIPAFARSCKQPFGTKTGCRADAAPESRAWPRPPKGFFDYTLPSTHRVASRRVSRSRSPRPSAAWLLAPRLPWVQGRSEGGSYG